MQRFTIVFNFVLNSPTQGLAASLSIEDDNQFLLDDSSNIALKPYITASLPPMQYISFASKSFQLTAASVPGIERQSASIILPVSANSPELAVQLPFPGVSVESSYMFIGYAQRGSLEYGDNVISFPMA